MMGFGMGGMGFIYMIIFWMVVIVLAIWLLSYLFPRIRSDSPAQPTTRGEEDAESLIEILQQRYARGEISRQEYLEIKRDLET